MSLVSKRNFGLDITRAISISLVVIAHEFGLGAGYELGLVGVQIFFILSGFLIGQILIKNFADSSTLTTVINFWKRRWYRTLPLYYLILTLKIVVYGNPYGWKMVVYYLFLQANIIGIDYFPVSWSLIVEEWFYIFLPLATFLFFRNGLNPKKFIIFLSAFIILFFVARFSWNYFEKGIILYQFDCLLLGVLLALFKLHFNPFYKYLNALWIFCLALFGIVIFTVLLGDIQKIPTYSTFYRVTWYFLISICITFIIPYMEQSLFLNTSIKKIKPIYYLFTWTSVLTYSIYLTHMDVFGFWFSSSYLLNTVLQIITLYSVSFILYAFYEHPMMSLRDKFSLKHYFNSVKSFSFKI